MDKLDDKLGAMGLIQALPEDYNLFVSSLLLKDDLDKAAVQIAFVCAAVGTALASSSASSTTCAFCGSSGHSQDICRQYTGTKDQVGKNYAPCSSPSPIPPSFDWLAETRATSHMTPHCHWVQNYLPLRIPIRLADNSIVYLSGVGTVVFNPVMMDGKPLQPVDF